MNERTKADEAWDSFLPRGWTRSLWAGIGAAVRAEIQAQASARLDALEKRVEELEGGDFVSSLARVMVVCDDCGRKRCEKVGGEQNCVSDPTPAREGMPVVGWICDGGPYEEHEFYEKEETVAWLARDSSWTIVPLVRLEDAERVLKEARGAATTHSKKVGELSMLLDRVRDRLSIVIEERDARAKSLRESKREIEERDERIRELAEANVRLRARLASQKVEVTALVTEEAREKADEVLRFYFPDRKDTRLRAEELLRNIVPLLRFLTRPATDQGDDS